MAANSRKENNWIVRLKKKVQKNIHLTYLNMKWFQKNRYQFAFILPFTTKFSCSYFFLLFRLYHRFIPSLYYHRPRYNEAADSTQLSDWPVESIPLSRMWNYRGTKEECSRKTHSWKVGDYIEGGECGKISEKGLKAEERRSGFHVSLDEVLWRNFYVGRS